MKSLLLLSSDDRRRYAEDIQTVLASPVGAIVQFRYREKFVRPALRRAVSAHQVIGLPAVLGFVGSDQSFVLPIRYATVARAEYVADMIVFKLRIAGYVNLERYPLQLPDLVTMSRVMIDELTMNENGVFYPATDNLPQVPGEVVDDIAGRWLAAAQRLAKHPTFENSYFLSVAPVENLRGKMLTFDKEGRAEAVDGQSLRIVANIYSEQYVPDAQFRLTCTPDGTNLRPASDEVYHIALKYDVVEFWLFLSAQSFDTLSRVTLSLVSDQGRNQDGSGVRAVADGRQAIEVADVSAVGGG